MTVNDPPVHEHLEVECNGCLAVCLVLKSSCNIFNDIWHCAIDNRIARMMNM